MQLPLPCDFKKKEMHNNKECHNFQKNQLVNCIKRQFYDNKVSRHGTLNNLHSKSEQQAINWNLIIAYTRKDMVIIMLNQKLNINNEWGGRRQYSCSLSAKKSMRRRVFMEPIYLEFREKLVGNEDESARAVSLADGPPIALLLTALVQLAA